MILVDTNVVSEPLRKVPEAGVIDWIDAQPVETLYLSAITVAELRFGVASLPTGKRRDTLHDNVETRVLPLFAGRVLAFDMAASQGHAELMAKARAAGSAIGKADGYVAATAATNGMMVATRDTAPGSFHAMAPVPGRSDSRSVIRHERLVSMSGYAFG